MSGLSESTFSLAPRGFATSFPAQDTPQEYSIEYKNLFSNSVGIAEIRPGLEQYVSALSEPITITNFHEILTPSGEAILFATGAGQIWKVGLDGVHEKMFTFGDTSAKIFSFHAARRLIFYNGVNRNVYTADGDTFHELLSILEVGTKAESADLATILSAAAITNWLGTDVAERDLVYYSDVSAYGVITSISSGAIVHTPVSGSAGGLGKGAIEVGSVPVSGQRFAILDTVELNIVPVSGLGFQTDNTAVLASGSNGGAVYIDLIDDWTKTEARVGDFVYNETRSQVSQIYAIGSAAAAVTPVINGQVPGDTVHFLKSSMPICKYGVSHFQRTYMIDARDDQKVRISGTGDPENLGGIDAGTYDISTQQPASERFRSLLSFQRFLIVGGTRNLYAFQGTDPIGVISRDDGSYLLNPDWTDLGLFPAGLLSRTGMVNVGNDIAWATNNGVRIATLSKTTNQLQEDSASSQIDKTLRELLKALPEDEIIAVHYPRRNWVLFKAGDELHVYNYANSGQGTQKTFIAGNEVSVRVPPAWHLFTGKFAQMKSFFIRESGDMICGGVGGQINAFDVGSYGDLGESVSFLYESAWHGFDTKNQKSVKRKHGKFIRPIFQAPNGVALEISVASPYAREGTDSVVVSAAAGEADIGSAVIGEWVIGGNDIASDKYPLRWHGETAKFRFEGETAQGPLTLSAYTVYYAQFGSK